MKTDTFRKVSKKIVIDTDFINSWNEEYERMKASGEIDKAMSELDDDVLWNAWFA